ncbi:hypothetical protein FOZ63_028110, partial [Perkinsus olseni]
MSVNHTHLAQLRKDLSSKNAIIPALNELSEMANDTASAEDSAFIEVCHRAFTVLNTRFSATACWQAGLELFLNVQFTCGESASISGERRRVYVRFIGLGRILAIIAKRFALYSGVSLPECNEWVTRALEESDEDAKTRAKQRMRASVRSKPGNL